VSPGSAQYVAHLRLSESSTATVCGEPWQGWQLPLDADYERDNPPLSPHEQPRPHIDPIRQCRACAQVASRGALASLTAAVAPSPVPAPSVLSHVVVGPGDVLVVTAPASATRADAAALSTILRERLGDRFVVIVNAEAMAARPPDLVAGFACAIAAVRDAQAFADWRLSQGAAVFIPPGGDVLAPLSVVAAYLEHVATSAGSAA
jgi:hypothetical protein